MAKIHAQTEGESSTTASGGQRDAGPAAAEPEVAQPVEQAQPWGSETAASPPPPEAGPMKHGRTKLVAGAALAGGGALATIRKRRRARAQQERQRRSLVPSRLRRGARQPKPSRLELLRSKLWRR